MSLCSIEDPGAVLTLLEKTPSSRFASNLGIELESGNTWDRLGSLFTGDNGNSNASVGVFANVVVSNVFSKIVSDCKSGIQSTQTIDIHCDGIGKSVNTKGCTSCVNTANLAKQSRYALELAARKYGRPVSKPSQNTVFDIDTRCSEVCNDCYVEDLNQNIGVTGFVSCIANVVKSDQMKTLLEAEVENQIFNSSDALGSLGRVLGGTDSCVTQSYVASITDIITQDFVNQVGANIAKSQNIAISGDGYVVKGVSQKITAKVFFQAIMETKAFTSLHTSSQVEAAQLVVSDSAELSDMLNNLAVPIQQTFRVIEDIFSIGGLMLGILVAMILLIWLYYYLMKGS